MTKFEEEAMNEFAKSEYVYTAYDGTFRGKTDGTVMEFAKGTTIYTFPWLEFAKNWHSDEEFQELLDKYSNLNDHYEKEVIKSSKLESQIIGLKSQLQQQPLPVVPEYVAKDVKRLSLSTLADWNVAVSYISKETLEWLSTTGNINVFLGKSWTLCSLKINGFKVEKTQLFYLKHIDMSKRDKDHDYFAQIRNDRFEHDSVKSDTLPQPEIVGVRFTQQEIDSMQTGSYEQIEVEK